MKKLSSLEFQKRLVDGSMVRLFLTADPEHLYLVLRLSGLRLHEGLLAIPQDAERFRTWTALLGPACRAMRGFSGGNCKHKLVPTCLCCFLQFVGEKKPYKNISQLWDGEVEASAHEE